MGGRRGEICGPHIPRFPLKIDREKVFSSFIPIRCGSVVANKRLRLGRKELAIFVRNQNVQQVCVSFLPPHISRPPPHLDTYTANAHEACRVIAGLYCSFSAAEEDLQCTVLSLINCRRSCCYFNNQKRFLFFLFSTSQKRLGKRHYYILQYCV